MQSEEKLLDEQQHTPTRFGVNCLLQLILCDQANEVTLWEATYSGLLGLSSMFWCSPNPAALPTAITFSACFAAFTHNCTETVFNCDESEQDYVFSSAYRNRR